jgi:hypothetical protein
MSLTFLIVGIGINNLRLYRRSNISVLLKKDTNPRDIATCAVALPGR